ncbi:uncharacterized protein LOC128206600 isoform X1 [Mya arenaria]|nr:uncharacterized protein LOC128206600 isoform X1 [Mya arenaria]XP_052765141.1 uncharacterized protein LOC128206600 isoform X1 [Mya arenaria]XP_052765142.1 uncharacterized protein LOC128206600 isoform X1 [Mya arenaria]
MGNEVSKPFETVVDTVKETSSTVVDTVKETSSTVVDTVKETSSTVVNTVNETGSTVVHKTNEIVDKCSAVVGESIKPTILTAVDSMSSSSTTYEREQKGIKPDLNMSPSYERSTEKGNSYRGGNNSSSLKRIGIALSEIKVCPENAGSVGRSLQDKYFSDWGEACYVKDYIGFSSSELHTIVEKIGDVFGDNKREIQGHLRQIQFCEDLDVKVFEFTFGEGLSSGQIQFGMIAISKSGIDLEAVSCLYQLNFTLAPISVAKETKRYFLWFEVGSSRSTWQEGTHLGVVTQKELLNFCRYKALRVFQNKNLVANINSVSTLDNV